MKKRLTAIMTAILCMTASISAISANAVEPTLNKDGSYTITAENFTYTSSPFQIESEIADPDFLVVGIIYSESDPSEISSYFIDPIVKPGCHSQGYGRIWSSTIKRGLGDIELHIGDLLKFDGGYDVLEVEPAIYAPYDDTKQIYLGNGVDVFGEEFADVIRMQVSFHQADFLRTGLPTENIDWGGITVHWGDANMDEQLDILDCIAVNKYLLGSSGLCYYARIMGDVNMDGKLDSTDSLAILKEVVGLTTDFK